MADVNDAVSYLREAIDAESDVRQLALTDLKFRYGEQWPQYAIASRGLDRPQLVINETDSFIRQITNAQRQQRPRIKVHPVDNFADPKVAKVITGLIRHIEVNSDADNAYDTAFDFAATMGFGYWRIRTDYVDDRSFNQEIFVDVVNNPFTVYFDYNSGLPDGSDAEKCLITDLMRKSVFEKKYPGAQLTGFSERGSGDNDPDWVTQHDIRIAEFFYVERIKAKLLMLSDGTVLFEDELPPPELLDKAGVEVTGDRDSFKRKVMWRKQTAFDILEEKELPGKFIPVVPVYWTNVIIDGKKTLQGLVRPSMDSQRMVNFWQTSITESIALAPKAKWLLAEGQDEGHEKEFASANLSSNALLRYKQTDVDGNPAPPPQRIAPEPPPSGAIEASFLASQNLQRVMGQFDPAVRGQQTKSGKAILAEQAQSDNSNFHGYDNLVRSLKQTGRIILDYIPRTYDVQRVQRIIGEDGAPKMVVLNDKSAIDKVLNDVTVGLYDVVMETGPGYDSKRQEGVDAMLQLMGTPIGPKIAQVGDDLLVRQMDFPQSDILADRLAANNPMAQVDENSEIPVQAQIMIKGLQGQLQQAQQVIQGLQIDQKMKLSLEKFKQDNETHREQMRLATKVHDVEARTETYQHDVEMRAITSQNIEEIRGIVTLLAKHLDISVLDRKVDAMNAEQQQKAAEVVGQEPQSPQFQQQQQQPQMTQFQQ